MELDERLVEAYNNISEAGYNCDEEEHAKYKQELLQLKIDDAEQLYIIAQHFMHGLGEYDIAKALLLKIQHDNEFYGQACIVLSDIERYGYENYDGAFKVLDEAIANGVAKDNVLFAKARIYVDIEEYQTALDCLDEIDATKIENYANILNWYIVVYTRIGNLDLVKEKFTLAEQHYSEDMSYPSVIIRYAKFLKEQQQYSEALVVLAKMPPMVLEYLEALDEYAAIYRQLADEQQANKYQKWKHVLEKFWARDGKVNSALWSNETVLDELHFWQQIPNENLEYYYAQMRMAFIAEDLGELEIARQLLDAIPEQGRVYISEEYEYSFEKIDAQLNEKLAGRKRPNTIPSEVFFDKKDSIWVLGTKNPLRAYVGEVTEWDQSGVLTEKAFYSGDEGDTVIFKTYNQAGEVWSDGTWVDGLMTENNVYRCKHSNHLLDKYGIEDARAAKIVATELALLNQSIAFTIYDKHDQEIGKMDYRDDNKFAEGFFEATTRNLLKAYSPIVRGTYGLIQSRLANVERAGLASETLQTLYDCLAFIADHVVDNDVVIDESFIAMHNMLDNSQFKSFNVNFESFIKAQARNYLAMLVSPVK